MNEVERGKKSYETHVKRLEENILKDNQLPTPSTSSSTGDPTLFTSSSTVTLRLLPHPIPKDQMILMSMALVSLPPLPSVFVHFLHITIFSLKKNLVNEKLHQPPKQRHML